MRQVFTVVTDIRVLGGLLVAALIANTLVLPLAGTFTLALVVGIVLVVATQRPEFAVVFVVIATFVVPSRYGLAGFSLIMAAGLLAFGLWFSGRMVAGCPAERRFGALDVVLYVVVLATLVSYIVGAYSFRSPGAVIAADRELVLWVSYLGMTLFIIEVVRLERRLYWLLNLVLLGVIFVASVVVAEFLLGRELTSFLRLPGFTAAEANNALPERFGVERRAGIAHNPIEFSAVMAIGLPLAVGQWLVAPTMAMRRVGGVAAILIVASLPLAVSRTGIVGLLFAVVLTVRALDGELRRKLLRRAGAVLLAVLIVMPTSLYLFSQVVTNFSNEEESLTTASRASDYEVVRAMVAERPLFGLGDGQFSATGTRLVEGRRIKSLWLDNDYLLALVRGGLLGLAALVALPVVGVAICRASRRRTGSRRIKVISNCCTVAIVTSAVTWAFYDASAFRMNRGFFFVILAIAGVLDNLTRGEEERRGTVLQAPEVPSERV